jgi:hypothetical protein
MWITRRQYNELHKSQSDYRLSAYNLQLKNESLSDGINHLKKEQEITLERYKRSGCDSSVEEYVKNVLDRGVEYSRYTVIDILQLLPEPYILGKYRDWWYCKDSTDSWGDVVYYKTAEEACANVYEGLSKERGMKEK